MTEFRRDPIIGQWVLVHTEDSFSPEQYDKEDHYFRAGAVCQFCPGKEFLTPPEVDALRTATSKPNTQGWKIRTISNKFPALRIEGSLDRRFDEIYEMSNGIGAHEVLIETAEHTKTLADLTNEEVFEVVKGYQRRLVDLTKDKRFKYVIVFKNWGESAGATVEHTHSQIIALPMIPLYVLEELEGTKRYFDRYKRCVFCDVLGQEKKDKERIVLENQDYISFCPFFSRYPFESWIVPKKHSSDFAGVADEQMFSFACVLKGTLLRLKECLGNPSYNFYLHIAPINYEGEQSYHWHMEIVPALTSISGFEWGTGFHVVKTDPAKAASFLRKVSIP